MAAPELCMYIAHIWQHTMKHLELSVYEPSRLNA